MKAFSLNLRGSLRQYTRPAVMGILNVTEDSFYAGSRAFSDTDISARAARLAAEGADFIDVGAYSTRPGAAEVPEAEETARLLRAIPLIRRAAPDVPLSVDTFRASAARAAIGAGADIVNDVSGGRLDPEMFDAVAEMRVPYILGHMRGTPADMQRHCEYDDLTADVIREMAEGYRRLVLAGVTDIIIDPCFGFSKTLEQNYELLRHLEFFEVFNAPVLVGVSRKSMITKLLNISSQEALPGTTALDAFALDRGAAILRVHDVLPAVQTVKIHQALSNL